MNLISSLRWPLILALGALALVRPLASIAGPQLRVDAGPVVPIALTAVISVVWIAVVGLSRTARPVATLVFAGLTYGILAIVLSGILSPILTGQLQGPVATPIAIIPVLATNVIWGLVTGALALALQRVRGYRAPVELNRS